MSVSRSVILLTQEEFEIAKASADPHEGEFWFHHCDTVKNEFWFGDGRDDLPSQVLDEIGILAPKVDDVVTLLEFLFLQGSESQQIDMFIRFLAANLGKSKIVHFWSE